MKILPDVALTYDDVLLVPQYSSVDSRRVLSTRSYHSLKWNKKRAAQVLQISRETSLPEDRGVCAGAGAARVKEGLRRRPGSLKAYVAAVFVLGLLAFTDALQSLSLDGLPYPWVILAMLAVGSQFTKLSSIKVPGISAHLSVSEILLFMIVLMYGAAPAIVTVAVDGLIFSLRQELKRKRASDFHYAAFDFAEPSLSMWVASGTVEPEVGSVAHGAWPWSGQGAPAPTRGPVGDGGRTHRRMAKHRRQRGRRR